MTQAQIRRQHATTVTGYEKLLAEHRRDVTFTRMRNGRPYGRTFTFQWGLYLGDDSQMNVWVNPWDAPMSFRKEFDKIAGRFWAGKGPYPEPGQFAPTWRVVSTAA